MATSSGMQCHQSIWKEGSRYSATNRRPLGNLSYLHCGVINTPRRSSPHQTGDHSYKVWFRLRRAGLLPRLPSATVGLGRNSLYRQPKAKPSSCVSPSKAYLSRLCGDGLAVSDGIKKKLDPAARGGQDLSDLPKEELKAIPRVAVDQRGHGQSDKDASSSRTAACSGDGTTSSIAHRTEETEVARSNDPAPVEVQMYYSL